MNVKFAARGAVSRYEALGKQDTRWQRLHDIIAKYSLMRGDFILSSGKSSKFLFQLRQTTMLPEGQSLIGSIIVDFMTKFGIGTVGGLEIGAVPVVAAVSHASFLCGSPVDAFFVRKRAKEHGAKELVDGNLREGAGVLMVDDVTTSGGSIIKAIDSVLSEKNIDVRWALSIVDREEGAAEALAARNILLASIFTRSDFGL